MMRSKLTLMFGMLFLGMTFPQINRTMAQDTNKPPAEANKIPDATLDPAEFKEPKKYIWRRPAEVKWVILFGCGGGGGGGGADSRKMNYAPHGEGGGASVPMLLLVGPLELASYPVEVGAGGKSGQPGSDTTFGYKQQPDSTTPFADRPPYFIFHHGGEGRDNGGNAPTGARSLYGDGGKAGLLAQSGSNAEARCAGGGGAGDNRPGDNPAQGGQGGPGYLVVYPLPDVARLAKIMGALEISASGAESNLKK